MSSRLWIGCAALAALCGVPAAAAVLSVTTLDDVDAPDGDCSLREAIVAANTDAAYQECAAGSGADEIELTLPGTITLTTDLEQIDQGLTLRGLGADLSVIDGGGTLEILHFVGAPAGNGELLRIEGLELTGGSASEGGAVFSGHDRALEIADCLFTGNQSNLDGGAVFADFGGSVAILRGSFLGNTAGGAGGGLAVHSGTTATVVDSTFAANDALGGPGGAIYAYSTDDLLLHQTTVSGNTASADGGGVAAVVGPVRLEASTLVENTCDANDNGAGDGGGLSTAGGPAVGTLVNTILAGNTDASTMSSVCPDGLRKLGASLITEGFNLVGANDCIESTFPAGLPNVNGDLVGTSAAPVDPLLEPLAGNGGATMTHLPQSGSPTIDQGNCPGIATDQRGYSNPIIDWRIIDDPAVPDFAEGCDIGSVERGAELVMGSIFADGFETGDTVAWDSTVE